MSQKQEFIGGMLVSAGVKYAAERILKAGVRKAVHEVARKAEVPINSVDADNVATELAVAMAKDPKTVNQMNVEPLVQSRVAQGSTMALLPALGYTVYAIFLYRLDLPRYMGDPTLAITVPVVIGATWSLFGRIKGGLGPVFGWFRK